MHLNALTSLRTHTERRLVVHYVLFLFFVPFMFINMILIWLQPYQNIELGASTFCLYAPILLLSKNRYNSTNNWVYTL